MEGRSLKVFKLKHLRSLYDMYDMKGYREGESRCVDMVWTSGKHIVKKNVYGENG